MEFDNLTDLLTELRDQLPVDIHALHLNAQEQPGLAEQAGRLAAELKTESKLARMRLEIAQAEADRDVRTNPSAHGLDKVTENSIKTAVTLARPVRDAGEAVIAADREAAMADAIANAYEHRRSTLKVEADLYGNNYWGSVDDLGKPRTAGREQMEEGVGETRSRRRRRVDGNGQ